MILNPATMVIAIELATERLRAMRRTNQAHQQLLRDYHLEQARREKVAHLLPRPFKQPMRRVR